MADETLASRRTAFSVIQPGEEEGHNSARCARRGRRARQRNGANGMSTTSVSMRGRTGCSDWCLGSASVGEGDCYREGLAGIVRCLGRSDNDSDGFVDGRRSLTSHDTYAMCVWTKRVVSRRALLKQRLSEASGGRSMLTQRVVRCRTGSIRRSCWRRHRRSRGR